MRDLQLPAQVLPGQAFMISGWIHSPREQVIGYSLRAWANRHVDASVLVLYNAVQPPATALLDGLPLIGQHRPYTLAKARASRPAVPSRV